MDLDRLFRYFDKNHDGKVSYNEFLDALKDETHKGRKDIIRKAYNKLSRLAGGPVDFATVRQAYNSTSHPEVRSGVKTRDQVLVEFMHKWGYIEPNRVITLEELENFYREISAGIRSDAEFENVIKSAWNLEAQDLI